MVTRQVILIVGPPGAGKSTLARKLAAERSLRHFEREMFPSAAAFLAAARRLGSTPTATAVVVRCCPSMADQRAWERTLGATATIVLDTDPDECELRIRQRGRLRWRSEAAAAHDWHRRRRAETDISEKSGHGGHDPATVSIFSGPGSPESLA